MSLHSGYQSANITGNKTVCYTLATISGRFGAKRPEELEGNAPRWITGHAKARPDGRACVPQAGALLLLNIK